jgi:hypothetical protein
MSEERSANERCGLVNAVGSDRIGLRMAHLDLAPQVQNKLLTDALAVNEKGFCRNGSIGLLRPTLPIFCNALNAWSCYVKFLGKLQCHCRALLEPLLEVVRIIGPDFDPFVRLSFPFKPLCLLAPPAGRDEYKCRISMDVVERLSRALVVVAIRLSRNRRLAAKFPKRLTLWNPRAIVLACKLAIPPR